MKLKSILTSPTWEVLKLLFSACELTLFAFRFRWNDVKYIGKYDVFKQVVKYEKYDVNYDTKYYGKHNVKYVGWSL